MFSLFRQTKKQTTAGKDFDYLDSKAYYFDSACQTLRPQQVIEAEVDYYQNFNSCGGRVKYQWGCQVDKLVRECRNSLLKLVGKDSKDYTVAFCLSTTHGINMVLHQLDPQKLDLHNIITSEIEHNSVFLNSITWAKKHGLKRIVLSRVKEGENFGALEYDKNSADFPANSLIIVNTMSNIDGQELLNVRQLAEDVHRKNGLLFLDACQTFGHNPEILQGVDFDVLFASGHKMYAPSVGFIIIKKSLLKKIDCYLIGGSTVQDVTLEDYRLIDNEEEIYARIEPGLQNYAGIIGLRTAIDWRQQFLKQQDKIHTFSVAKDNSLNYEEKLAWYLHQKLQEIPQIKLLNNRPSVVVSFYTSKMDSHKIAMYLSEFGIMCRSGYHCCHYYLKNKLNLPPLLRISLGLNNTPEQIDYLIDKLKLLLS